MTREVAETNRKGNKGYCRDGEQSKTLGKSQGT